MEPGVVFNATTETLADHRFPNSTTSTDGKLFTLIKQGNYAEGLQADELHLNGAMDRLDAFRAGAADLFIYVRAGSGTLVLSQDELANDELASEEEVAVRDGTAVHIKSHESFYLRQADQLEMFIVRVPDVSGPYARKQHHPSINFTRSVQQGLSATGSATGNREYEVLFDAQSGSSGATMFVGFIPPSGAPAHYHLYDEICQIIKGSGQLQTGSTLQPLSVGSTFSIVPRFLHSVINDTSENLWILGTFRPEGSPAAAYYPDGRPAPGYEEN
jgi:mannose-6-phosphate isomerase-like protein (cupin superfamily)